MIDIVKCLTENLNIPEVLSKSFDVQVLGESGELWIDLTRLGHEIVVYVDYIAVCPSAEGFNLTLTSDDLIALATLQQNLRKYCGFTGEE